MIIEPEINSIFLIPYSSVSYTNSPSAQSPDCAVGNNNLWIVNNISSLFTKKGYKSKLTFYICRKLNCNVCRPD